MSEPVGIGAHQSAPVRVVVAPDKFRGSATAAEAAAAIAAGLRRVRQDLDVVELPVADGGDGTVAAALAAGYAPVLLTADGPVGEQVTTTFAVRQQTAVIELADVAGLKRLPHSAALAPLAASTYGVGQVIAAAIGAGASTVVLGIGGSASTDGGAGLMQALGLRLSDRRGRPLRRGGAALADLASIDLSGLDPRLPEVRFLVASDVANSLLGPEGAAHVFGPQKGASPADVALLERAMSRWARLTQSVTGRDLAGAPGAGAAGGTGYAALAYLGARLIPGIELVLDLVDFDAAVTGAELVITGEGRLDGQTLAGKAPLGVARAARRRGVPAVALAGQVLLSDDEVLDAGFAAAYSLSSIEPDQRASMARAVELLEQAGAAIAVDALRTSRPGTH